MIAIKKKKKTELCLLIKHLKKKRLLLLRQLAVSFCNLEAPTAHEHAAAQASATHAMQPAR